MQKLRFALDVEDDWPPVATESIWCNVDDDIYKLQNAPFFIKGLAWGDKFGAIPDPVNGCIFDFSIVKDSGHSLIWILKGDGSDITPFKDRLLHIGCRVEGFPAFHLWSVDVPRSANPEDVEAELEQLESHGFAIAVPVWRFES